MQSLTFGLSLLLILVIPLENSIVLPGFGTVARGIGLLAAAIWLLERLRTGRLRRPVFFHMSVLLFIGWNLFSFFWSIDPGRTYARLVTYMQLLVMVFLIWDLYRSSSALRKGLQVFVFGCVGALASLFGALSAGNTVGISQRYAAAGFDPNFIGFILAVGLAVALFLIQERGTAPRPFGPLLRIINVAYIPAAVAAILLTGSRTAGLALLPGLIYGGALLFRKRSWKGILVLITAVAALWATLPILPEAPLERVLGTTVALSEGDLSGRLGRWRDGLEMFAERPLLGVGTGAFGAASSLGSGVAHNVFLGILDETGLVGLALFGTVIAAVVRSALTQAENRKWLWLAIVFAWLVAAGSLSIEFKKLTWLLLTLVTAGAHVVEDQAPSYERIPAVYD